MSQSTTLEKLEGLKRRIDISVPASDVDQVYQQEMKKVAKTAKVDGFRPGKVPAKVLEQRFRGSILVQIAQELIQKSLVNAIEEHKLNIVGTPEVTPKEIKRGEPFEFSASFEVYPEIELADMSAIKVEQPKLDLKDADIDNMLQTLQKQHADWEEVEKAAADGDQIEMDFEGFIDGEAFDKGSAQNFKLELGSNRMIPGFEESLKGVKPGEERDIECTFPKDYPAADLADKKATFKTKIHKVMQPKLPEVNDDFALKIGIKEGGVDALRKEVERNMQMQVEQMLKDKVKLQVMDQLVELNEVTVPQGLIDIEIEHLQKMMKQKVGDAAAEIDDNMYPRSQFEEQAQRRVTLGLILGEVVRKFEIKVDGQKVRERIEQIASVYHDPAQVVNWYYNNKQMLAEVESVVMEDQAVTMILETAQVEEKLIGYDEAINPQSEENQSKSEG